MRCAANHDVLAPFHADCDRPARRVHIRLGTSAGEACATYWSSLRGTYACARLPGGSGVYLLVHGPLDGLRSAGNSLSSFVTSCRRIHVVIVDIVTGYLLFRLGAAGRLGS